MTEHALTVYVGWDVLDMKAYDVCVKTLRERSSIPLRILPLKEQELRWKGLYWRPYTVDENGQRWDHRDARPFSTSFSFTRFMVPILEKEESNLCVYMDPDMLWKGDVAELIGLCGEEKSVYCVQHNQIASEAEKKMGGLMQTMYKRKNWSSLMVFRPYLCKELTKYAVNNQTGAWLHGMCWADSIGEIPPEWNWLEGYHDPAIDPKVIHYTRGTPDIPGCEAVDKAKEWWDAA